MTERRRATTSINAAKTAIAGLFIAGSALAMAGQAGADPVEPYPLPTDPGAPAPAPGQPVVEALDGQVPAPAPPPVGGPPTVPEIQNPVYGANKSGGGALGSLRDLWHAANSDNPVEAFTAAPDASVGPPPGAGPAPKLPPGYTSLTAPESSTPATEGTYAGGPALPPGYYPLNGPPPPGYAAPAPVDPAAPPLVEPVPATP